MPIKKGSSKKTVSNNIKEMFSAYKTSGKIGSSKPSSNEKAQKQAVAIALSSAGKSRRTPSLPKGRQGAVRTVKKRDGNTPVKIY
jgi:hypothetical protein